MRMHLLVALVSAASRESCGFSRIRARKNCRPRGVPDVGVWSAGEYVAKAREKFGKWLFFKIDSKSGRQKLARKRKPARFLAVR